MSNVNDFIASLNAIAEKNSIRVFLPSLQRVVRFKPINAKQHKSIYSCAKDNVIYNTKFIITTYNIIKENCLEPDVISELNIIDRTYILLALRKDVLGTVYKNINFESCLGLTYTTALPVSDILNINDVKIQPQIPLLEESYKMELELRSDLQDETITIDTLTEELIINSCCKFIKEIWVGDVQINFGSFNFKERLTIVENLPAVVLNHLQYFAGKVTELQDSITAVTDIDKKTQQFYIDTDFFLT